MVKHIDLPINKSDIPQYSIGAYLTISFVTMAIAISAMPGWNFFVLAWGGATATVFLLESMTKRIFMPTELWLYGGFVLWGATGLAVAPNADVVTTRLFTIAMIWGMAWLVSNCAKSIPAVWMLLYAYLAGVAVVYGVAFITGEFQMAASSDNADRAAGLTGNANSFGLLGVLGFFVLANLFLKTKRFSVKVLIVCGVLVIINAVILSASRKAFGGFLIVAILFMFYNFRVEITKKPVYAILGLLMVLGIFFYGLTKIQDSTLMRRLEQGADQAQTGASDKDLGVRTRMISTGLEIWRSSPITGVGLNCYGICSGEGGYAHNNPIEIMSTTGTVGFMLYYSIYWVFALKVWRLARQDLSSDERQIVNMGKTFLTLSFFFDIGVVSYFAKWMWILFSIFIGYTHALSRQVEARKKRRSVNENNMLN